MSNEDNHSVLSVLLARIRVDSNVEVESIKVASLNNRDCIVLLMGPPGSGKSTFMEVVSGTRISGRRGSEHPAASASAFRLSVPKTNPPSPLHDSSIVLVNIPAFNDVAKPDQEILHIISGWLQKTYQNGIYVSGMIFFHRISDARLEGTPLRNWRAFENICGDRFKNVVIATTMWGDIDGDIGNTREQELREFLGNHGGWTTHRFHHVNRSSAADILAPILDHQAKQPLLLQSEVSDFRLSLRQTSATRGLYSELEALLRVTRTKHREIQEALRDRSMSKDKLKDLEDQLQKSYALIDRVTAAQHELQETPGDRFQRRLLQTPVLGAALRAVGLPRRPGQEFVDFEVAGVAGPNGQ